MGVKGLNSKRKKEIICHANRSFMSFSRGFVNVSSVSLETRARTCYVTVLVCNSIWHVRGPGQGVLLSQCIEPPACNVVSWPGN